MSLIASASNYAFASPITTAGIDTTGAKTIAIYVCTVTAVSTTAVTDSNGNTYTARTIYNNGTVRARWYYCLNPTVGAGHTFTLTTTGTPLGGLAVLAFSEECTYADESGGSASATTTIQPGSQTPSADGALLVYGVSGFASAISLSSVSIGTIGPNQAGVSSVCYGFACAYYVQPTAGAINPTMTIGASGSYAASMLQFSVTALPDLSGNVTLDAVAPAGTFASSSSDIGGNVTLDTVAPAGTLGVAPGTVTVPALKNWSGSLQTSVTIPVVTVLSMATGAQVLALTDQATHATTADLEITDAALAAGTTYMVAGWSADGSSRFAVPITAA